MHAFHLGQIYVWEVRSFQSRRLVAVTRSARGTLLSFKILRVR